MRCINFDKRKRTKGIPWKTRLRVKKKMKRGNTIMPKAKNTSFATSEVDTMIFKRGH